MCGCADTTGKLIETGIHVVVPSSARNTYTGAKSKGRASHRDCRPTRRSRLGDGFAISTARPNAARAHSSAEACALSSTSRPAQSDPRAKHLAKRAPTSPSAAEDHNIYRHTLFLGPPCRDERRPRWGSRCRCACVRARAVWGTNAQQAAARVQRAHGQRTFNNYGSSRRGGYQRSDLPSINDRSRARQHPRR